MSIPAKAKPFLCLAAGLLVPGLGHFFQKKPWKGAIFLAGVLALLGLGLIMGGGFGALTAFEPLTVLTFLGSIGNGLFYAAARLAGLGAGNLTAFTYQVGSMYIAAAGFMNGLIALNGWKAAKEAGRV
ncbi:MAG: hypothetical protein NTU60_04935 [Candidatus Aminicenantes bacterium]|jgi:hypothetical protein|nr:hypothetical protein [Candidatus Aminicenantes bacterium]